MTFATIPEAIADFQNGKMVIIVDDEDRENEGDLAIAADKCTPDIINFMAIHGRGLICISMTAERLEKLRIPMMVQDNTAPFSTAFTVSVEGRREVTTGISAFDRARTVSTLIDPDARPEDLTRPGHMFPLRAREGGVLVRAGQTEAVVDLAKLSGLYPAGVICEIMKYDGSMARMPDLTKFANEHDLKIITVADLISFRMRNDKLVKRFTESTLPTAYGEFQAIAYSTSISQDEHIALIKGEITGEHPVLVRVHSQCLTGDVFSSSRCDCGEQMGLALKAIEKEGTGIFLYMRQEGRGVGLHNNIKPLSLQDHGMTTVEANEALGFPADRRDYGIGMQILVDLGVREMRLLTNNPSKRAGLEGYNLKVVERVPIQPTVNEHNKLYLETKKQKLGHLI